MLPTTSDRDWFVAFRRCGKQELTRTLLEEKIMAIAKDQFIESIQQLSPGEIREILDELLREEYEKGMKTVKITPVSGMNDG